MHNSKIALISDAGSPLISDPGYKFVKYFLDNNIYVTTVSGGSAVISALQLSGLPINNFVFYGFVPKQESKKKQFFKKIKDVGITSVFFVSAKNLIESINKIIEFIGEREISVCKEITKLNELVLRTKTNKILQLLKEQKVLLKGEFTIVVSGETKKKPKIINNDIKNELIKLLKKYNLTEAVKIVHSLTGISRKNIYKTAVKIKND